jgi:PAS domain S-box-containing protein
MHLGSPLVFDDIFCNAESTSLLIFNRSGIIEDINFGFEKLLGYSLDSIVGKNISELYTSHDLEKNHPQNVIKRALETGASHDDNFLKHQSGSLIWVHSECVLAKDRDGQEHLVKIIHDLNKEKLLEEQLREKNREQEQIILDHDTFVYTASHDLRSPLNNLDALVQNVEESYNDQEMIGQLIPLLKDSIVRLRNKIDELSIIGKRREEENGKSAVAFQSVYDEVLKDLELEISASGANLSADFSRLPVIRFSKKNVRSLLQNLVSNALRYRHPERKPVIHIQSEHVEEGVAALEVEDNGLGIKEEEKERIFEMYTRFHTHVEGTGVGLGLVKKIVDNNGGRIEVESRPDKGSRFKVYLKVRETILHEQVPEGHKSSFL